MERSWVPSLLVALFCVQEQDTITPQSTDNTQEAVVPDMTEKLLTRIQTLYRNICWGSHGISNEHSQLRFKSPPILA